MLADNIRMSDEYEKIWNLGDEEGRLYDVTNCVYENRKWGTAVVRDHWYNNVCEKIYAQEMTVNLLFEREKLTITYHTHLDGRIHLHNRVSKIQFDIVG